MSKLEPVISAWCGYGWLLLLAFTASILVVAALRKPCQKVFGVERAFLLWLLAPLSLLAASLPHPIAQANPLPPVLVAISSVPGALLPGDATEGMGDWQSWICLLWSAGVAVTLSLGVYAQSRYRARLRGAGRYGALSAWPILRAVDSGTGPALVGAWRPHIVVPADFDNRYNESERALVLAHEAMHARRLDGCWSLLAHLMTAVFWFHPLAWWALSTLRRDQELACDAAVLRENRGLRRSYANALLKTQPTELPLPVGCAWSPRHPLTERIAMLKKAQPSPNRRAVGFMSVLIAVLLGAGVSYAATAPATAGGGHADRYTLKVALVIDGNAPRLHATRCLKPGEHYDVTETEIGKLPPWHGQFSVSRVANGLLEVRAEMNGGPLESAISPRVRTHSGQTATIEVGGERSAPKAVPGGHVIKIDLTPAVGC